MNLVPRYDDSRPKTLKVTGGTRKIVRTDGQRLTIIRPVKYGRIKSHFRIHVHVNILEKSWKTTEGRVFAYLITFFESNLPVILHKVPKTNTQGVVTYNFRVHHSI